MNMQTRLALAVCLGLFTALGGPAQADIQAGSTSSAAAGLSPALPDVNGPGAVWPAAQWPVILASLPPLQNIVAVAAGGYHTCALTANGGVKCWGHNYAGQLGDGTTIPRNAPMDVVGLSGGVQAIAAGHVHTCAVTTGGGVKCWGWNGLGQLGDGTTTGRTTPVDVAGLSSGVKAVVAGYYHTCALTTDGGVKCWGRNEHGQLGNGTTTSSSTPVDVIGLSSGVMAIAAGGYHTCALTTGGGVKCWGFNWFGQLGDGSTANRTTPVDVSGLSSGVASITAGDGHTCALMSGGGVKCWGANGYGQLGDGTTTNRNTPVDVSGLGGSGTAIVAGYCHTCAVVLSGGMKCWGANWYGQLGDGTTTNRITPVDVSGLGSGVTTIAAGCYHTCAVVPGGGVRCWGANWYGQLGDGTTVWRNVPVDVPGLGSGMAAVAAGWTHTCALTAGGGAKCWGGNEDGQLGNGTRIPSGTPVDVVGLPSGARSIVTGWYHTCTLTTGGGVKCWGRNLYGQLGDGTMFTWRTTPVDVVGLSSGVAAITAGEEHTCALTTGGGVKCWGRNQYGELGDGTTTSRSTPVDVLGLGSGVVAIATSYDRTCALTAGGGVKCWGGGRTTPEDVPGLGSGVAAIAVGAGHSCALTTGGGVKCWGANWAGQLGDGTTDYRSTPVDVVGLGSGVEAVTAGGSHTCALITGGRVKCWGDNLDGQLGDGTRAQRTTPVDVSGLGSGIQAIAAGQRHTCAITAGGGVKCWGWDGYGQLGLGTVTVRTTPVDVLALLTVYLPLVLRGY